MKKINGLILVVLLFAIPAFSQTIFWDTRTSATIQWTAAPKANTTDNANQYQVYYRVFPDITGDGIAVGAPITAIQLALIIPPDVQYLFGVKTLRFRGGVKVSESATGWSNDLVVTNNTPFGFLTTVSPLSITGLKVLP